MKYVIILFAGLLFACKESELCFTPPQPVTFEFVDEDGNNMISNGLLHANNFEFREELGNMKNKLVPHEITDDDRIQLNEVGWTVGVTQYKFLSIIHSFPFVIRARENNNCGGTKIEEVLLSDVDYEDRSGIIRVTLVQP